MHPHNLNLKIWDYEQLILIGSMRIQFKTNNVLWSYWSKLKAMVGLHGLN